MKIDMQTSPWNAVNVGFVSSNAMRNGFESWELCNAHDIISLLF